MSRFTELDDLRAVESRLQRERQEVRLLRFIRVPKQVSSIYHRFDVCATAPLPVTVQCERLEAQIRALASGGSTASVSSPSRRAPPPPASAVLAAGEAARSAPLPQSSSGSGSAYYDAYARDKDVSGSSAAAAGAPASASRARAAPARAARGRRRDDYSSDEDDYSTGSSDYSDDESSLSSSIEDDRNRRKLPRGRDTAPAAAPPHGRNGTPAAERENAQHVGKSSASRRAGVSYRSPMYRSASPRRRVGPSKVVISNFARSARFRDDKEWVPGTCADAVLLSAFGARGPAF